MSNRAERDRIKRWNRKQRLSEQELSRASAEINAMSDAMRKADTFLSTILAESFVNIFASSQNEVIIIKDKESK